MTEDDAREMFERWRWPNGPQCPRCERGDPYIAHDRRRGTWAYRCKYPCGYRYTVKTDTVMERSTLPYSKWADAFMRMSKNPDITHRALQRQLGIHHTTAARLYADIMSTMRSNMKPNTEAK